MKKLANGKNNIEALDARGSDSSVLLVILAIECARTFQTFVVVASKPNAYSVGHEPRQQSPSDGERPTSPMHHCHPVLTAGDLQYFDGGDAWFTPLAKIAIDQTAFAFTWNSLYLVMLGEPES